MIARWFWREWRSPSLLIVWLALSPGGGLRAGAGVDRRSDGKGAQPTESRIYGRGPDAAQLA